MGDLLDGWRIAIARLRAHWRLMLVAAAGVLVAATLLAVTPVYATAMTDLGLRFRVARQLSEAADRFAYLEIDRVLLGDPADRARREALDRITEARVGWLGTPATEERTPPLSLSFVGHEAQAPARPVGVTARGTEPVRQRWTATVTMLSDVEQHVQVVEGRLPGAATQGVEVVLPDGYQRHARVGDVVRLAGAAIDDCVHIPSSQETAVALAEIICRPTLVATPSATATIVGFVRPTRPDDARWAQFDAGWGVPDRPSVPRGAPGPEPGGPPGVEGTMSLITTRAQFSAALATRMPELGTRYRSGVLLDPGALTLAEVPRAIGDLEAWRADATDRLRLVVVPRTPVLDVLQGFRNAQTFSQVPLLLILLQVVGIVLYYVAMMMALLLDRQAEEIGVLRSRGASTAQLVGLHLVEGIALAVPAAFAGPWLAARIVEAMGRAPAFHAITGGAPLDARTTPLAALLGAVGAALALAAILLPSYLVARRGLAGLRREAARPPARSLVQRTYLDLGCALFAAFLLWQLRQRGTVFDPGSVGGWSADPLLLLSPLVLTLAAALLLLRVFPFALRVVVLLLARLRGTAVALGLRHAGRAPTMYARLLLLVVMAVSVGTFAASYGPTVGRSLDERARYAAGVDTRVSLERRERPGDEAIAAVRAMPGVADATLVHRGSVGAANGTSVAVLAIDPVRAASMLWSRDDFAARPMPEVLRLLQNEVRPGGGVRLPDDVTAITVRLRSASLQRAAFQVRLRDARGEMWSALLQVPDGGEWVTATAALPAFATRPLTFLGFRVGDRQGLDLRRDGALQIDRVEAIGRGGATVIDDFEGPFGWMILGAPARDEAFRPVDGKDAASGVRYAEWRWSPTIAPQDRMLVLNDPGVPLWGVMSPAAMRVLGTGEGGVASLVMNRLQIPVVVRSAVDLFPTLDPSQAFVVLNDEQLDSIAGAVGADELRLPTELWLRFQPGASIADRRATLAALAGSASPLRVKSDAVIEAALRDDAASDPTLQAAGSGILALAFVAVLALCTVGVIVTLTLGARARATEFAVLRAVGASRRQILRGLLLEWGSVLLVGAVVGLALGRIVASLMLRFLEVTERGDRVLPPFILQTDWRALGAGLALLAVAVVATLLVAWTMAMRRPASAELRLTE